MKPEFSIFHPGTDAEFAARDALLQASLREPGSRYSITREYPLVLAKDAASLSLCATGPGVIVGAHVNLFPREFVFQNGTRRPVGLVGNVATDASLRGKGVMTKLFKELERIAQGKGLEALLLWSDLNEFYQKLGFRPTGRELRYLFTAPKLQAKYGAFGAEFDLAGESDRAKFSGPDLAALLASRCPMVATLARSADEFRRQLTIPETTLAVRKTGGPAAFVVTGKGHDMVGVAHEWGGPSPAVVLGALAKTVSATGLGTVLLLVPKGAPSAWHQAFAAAAESAEAHPMAWLKPLRPTVFEDQVSLAEFASAFVWGLDSI